MRVLDDERVHDVRHHALHLGYGAILFGAGIDWIQPQAIKRKRPVDRPGGKHEGSRLRNIVRRIADIGSASGGTPAFLSARGGSGGRGSQYLQTSRSGAFAKGTIPIISGKGATAML